MSTTANLTDLFTANCAKLTKLKAIAGLWQRDGNLYCQNGENLEVARAVRNRLGWLFSAPLMRAEVERLAILARVVERQRYDRIIVVGMGGSSLWPEVIGRHLQGQRGLAIRVADSTHPGAVADLLAYCKAGKPLFIIATKSGSTIETSSIYRTVRPIWNDGQHFVAITDPGSALEKLAKDEGFRDTFLNPADIGGRFSAASLFGLVPAALAGVPLHESLQRVEDMLQACRDPDPVLNPGASLGAWLAAGVQSGRWQLRLSLSKDVRGFGAWVEQLIAESTGKLGTGLLPLVGGFDGEGPEFAKKLQHALVVSTATFAHPDDGFVDRARDAGVPDQSFVMPDPLDLWSEVVRWEFATAICGLLLNINPFDEPDVSSAKAATQAILAGTAQPIAAHRQFEIATLSQIAVEIGQELGDMLADDYLVVLAFVAPTSPNLQRLEALRLSLQAKTLAAVTVQVGPRYLHSTGQFYKGGQPRGHFVVVTDLGRANGDIDIPQADLSFGKLARAQADGDAMILSSRNKRVLWADLAETAKTA